MNVFEAILSRYSVRSYTTQEVEQATIQTLLEAAVHAPTAMHQEPWAFVVIRDRLQLQRLSDIVKLLFTKELHRIGQTRDTFSDPDFNVFYNAGTLIVIGSELTGRFVDADCWLAAENLMLAACAMGLGTCVIGSALSALTLPEVKAEFGIPASFSAVAPIIVGYPRDEVAPTSRKVPHVLSFT
jgi:nitroreductase